MFYTKFSDPMLSKLMSKLHDKKVVVTLCYIGQLAFLMNITLHVQ